MIKTVKEAKELAKQWNAIKTDLERLQFLKDHKDKMKVILDNDQSMAGFILDEQEDEEVNELITEIELNDFREYHGWQDSIIELFEFAGITAESC